MTSLSIEIDVPQSSRQLRTWLTARVKTADATLNRWRIPRIKWNAMQCLQEISTDRRVEKVASPSPKAVTYVISNVELPIGTEDRIAILTKAPPAIDPELISYRQRKNGFKAIEPYVAEMRVMDGNECVRRFRAGNAVNVSACVPA